MPDFFPPRQTKIVRECDCIECLVHAVALERKYIKYFDIEPHLKASPHFASERTRSTLKKSKKKVLKKSSVRQNIVVTRNIFCPQNVVPVTAPLFSYPSFCYQLFFGFTVYCIFVSSCFFV